MRIVYGILCMLITITSSQVLVAEENAREIEVNLRSMTPENARGYLMPLMGSYAASINRSTFHTAELQKGLTIYIGMKAMMAIIPDASKTFPAVSPDNVSRQHTATVVGNSGNGQFPDGFNWNVVPVMIPQFQLGNFWGTQLLFRYLPTTKFDDKIGHLDVIGGGITHSLSQYLPELPVQFSVQGFYQYTKLGTNFESTGTLYNVIASTRFAGLTLYGGLGYEYTDVHVEYVYSPENNNEESLDISPVNKKFTESFEDHLRATLGLSLNFIIFNLNADYSFGEYHVATVGLGISI